MQAIPDVWPPFPYWLRKLIDVLVQRGFLTVHSPYVKPVLLRLIDWGGRLGNGRIRRESSARFFESNSFVSRAIYQVILLLERVLKVPLFGCHECGQCILSYTGYTCPMRCLKGLRNGPCGGASKEGRCEVYPDRDCVWNLIYIRAKRLNRLDRLAVIRPPLDWSLIGTSSWVNFLTGRDGLAQHGAESWDFLELAPEPTEALHPGPEKEQYKQAA